MQIVVRALSALRCDRDQILPNARKAILAQGNMREMDLRVGNLACGISIFSPNLFINFSLRSGGTSGSFCRSQRRSIWGGKIPRKAFLSAISLVIE